MGTLIGRANGVMNAVLIATLLLVLPILGARSDIIGEGVALLDASRDLHGSLLQDLDAGTQAQVDSYNEDTAPTATMPLEDDQKRERVKNINVYQILKIRERFSGIGMWSALEAGDGEEEKTSALIVTAQRASAVIEAAYYEAKLGSSATFGELQEAKRKRLSLPLVGQVEYVEKAVPLVGIGVTAALLLLFSLFRTIRATLTPANSDQALSWIFLHEGVQAPVLGFVWLSLPAIVTSIALLRGVIPALIAVPIMIACAAAGGAAFREGMLARRHVRGRAAAPTA